MRQKEKLSLIDLSIIFSLLLLLSQCTVTAAPVIYKDFSAYVDSEWTAVRDPSFSAAGSFVQRTGYIQNYYPPNTDTGKIFAGETGYAMRVLKNTSAYNGKVEMELLLMGYAAPSIFVRTRVAGDKHYEGYNCVIYNFNPYEQRQGINIWVLNPSWALLKAFNVTVSKYKKIKFGVEFVDSILTFYVNDNKVGTYKDPKPFPKGAIGMCSIEGPNYFFNFKFTSYDTSSLQPAATPQISPLGGTFNDSVKVKITTATTGAAIFYTLNNTEPSVTSLRFMDSLYITKSCTLKAVAAKSGMANSPVAKAAFLIKPSGNILEHNTVGIPYHYSSGNRNKSYDVNGRILPYNSPLFMANSMQIILIDKKNSIKPDKFINIR